MWNHVGRRKMDEQLNGTIPMEPAEPTLKRLQAICEEHFDDYLIIVKRKNESPWRAYSDATQAFGMASMVCTEINQRWYKYNSDNK